MTLPDLTPPKRTIPIDELCAIALGGGPECMPPGHLYFLTRGRIPRRDFWLHGVLVMLLLNMLITALMEIAGFDTETAVLVAGALLIWPLLAISVKRIHDFNWSGWWVLLHFLPGAGSLALVAVLGCAPGTHGPNRFGSAPPRLRQPLPLPVNSDH